MRPERGKKTFLAPLDQEQMKENLMVVPLDLDSRKSGETGPRLDITGTRP